LITVPVDVRSGPTCVCEGATARLRAGVATGAGAGGGLAAGSPSANHGGVDHRRSGSAIEPSVAVASGRGSFATAVGAGAGEGAYPCAGACAGACADVTVGVGVGVGAGLGDAGGGKASAVFADAAVGEEGPPDHGGRFEGSSHSPQKRHLAARSWMSSAQYGQAFTAARH
jgi:hypothetical protein